MNTINAAAREYANRPADERYPSPAALVTAAGEDKRLSREITHSLRDLRAVAEDDTIRIASPRGVADLTHWSFGQIARTLGAPAGYLRTLSPQLGADCLNYGLQTTPSQDAVLLVRAANGKPRPVIRACTSETYGRVWDADLYGNIVNQVMAHDAKWQLPPTWSGEPAGAYRGDRDSFLIITNGGSIVEDPTLRNRPAAPDGTPADQMYRGILLRNSEVGAASIVIETILFRYICGNHMLWGAVSNGQFRRRHVGSKAFRDTIREISRIAYSWAAVSPARDQAIIRALIDHEIGQTKDAVIDELRKLGATEGQAAEAYRLCEQTESASPRSFWGAAQGLTRAAQATAYQDERYQLDRIASQLMARGAKLLVAA